MSYSTKYQSIFKDISDNTYQMNFKKLDYTGSITELPAALEPLIIETPSTKKFSAVKGSGATIKLVSEADRQLLDLYTANYKEWKIEILKNGSAFFKGYVESELYEEDFTRDSNYVVQITCNNGIGILERERYLENDGSKIVGLNSVFDVVSIIIEKINLDYSALNIATDLSINSTTLASNKSILQHIALNNENYTDEDENAFTCRKVLEAVLEPFSLSFFIEGDTAWIVDTEYLKNSIVNYKSFSISNNIVSVTCTNHSLDVSKDLSNIDKLASNFTIQAGFNNYKLTKNRYVKDIIKKVDFSDEENFSGNIYSDVWDFKNDSVRTDIYSTDGTDKRYWINKIDSFDSYTLNSSTVPNANLPYFSLLPVSYAGGIKNQKIVDSTLINYDVDDIDFDNYIFVQSPYRDYEHSYFEDPHYSPYHHFELTLSEIIRTAFTYNRELPFIFNSNSVKIRLNYTVKVLSSGLGTNEGTMGGFKWKNIDELTNSYGVFLYYTKIHFVDNNGNIKYFLRLQGSENFDKDSEIPKYENAVYELVQYTGQSFIYCLLYFENVNEAGNMMSIINSDFTSYIDIPVSFDKLYKLKIEFMNCFFPVIDWEIVSGGVVPTDYYTSTSFFKESFPHIAFKDIYTEIIDNTTGEAVPLNDEEIEYYLEDTYKNDEESTTVYNYTADNKYISDVAGMMIADNSSLSDMDYMDSITANSYTKANLEDLKGDKIIRQYQNNQVVLVATLLEDNITLINTLKLSGDAFWSNKKWVITALSNNVADNQVEITLEEIF